jgi:2-oxoglutarate dehydrogenase E1 component
VEIDRAFVAPPSVVGSVGSQIPAKDASYAATTAAASAPMLSDSLGVSYLIRAYQVRGHEVANLDPLGIHSFRSISPPLELDYKTHGFKDEDLDRNLNLLANSTGGYSGFLDILGNRQVHVTLRQVVDNLKKTYCSTLGVEYMHISSRERCNWIRNQVETPKWMKFSKEKRLHIYERLCFAENFEKFLANKFNTAKRFGLEGGESCIPGLKCMIDHGSELGIESFIFGMPHVSCATLLFQCSFAATLLLFEVTVRCVHAISPCISYCIIRYFRIGFVLIFFRFLILYHQLLLR